ncbi:MAG: BCD family MFS transporter [Sphingomonas sp.]|uniref:BCD family MFS transporter n=1 Tax=Sphingomonas sp. TaxID=28214 RepID=UPI0025FE4E44|nr:BCD family MFS transporter [Sphingomonas sp.]MBY0285424.1 BCD family MFS transporter [Sphingomonas sp.]
MKPLGWFGIARLGLVQFAIGAVVMLASSLLNRLMVVEYALPAAVPAGLVAWHYAVQLSRPVWGHGSDKGHRRTPWIIGGMAMLAGGAMLAVASLGELGRGSVLGFAMAILAFSIIGAGVGAAGTSLLALLATRTAPERRAAAAAITWIMMIVGIVITASIAGRLIDPFTPQRLALVAGGVVGGAFLVSLIGIWGIEGTPTAVVQPADALPAQSFGEAVREMLAEPEARHFTGFVFLAMLAYSMQDLILEPFAGLVFGMTPGQSTQLSGTQHSGVLLGMILVGIGGSAFGGGTPRVLRRWIVGGCLGSALALAGLGLAARAGAGWPLAANIWALGFANGVFAVAAIGAMMSLAGAAGPQREGVRMGVWGAAQAIAFGLGGLTGAVGVDLARAVMKADGPAFTLVFAVEGGLFLAAAWLAVGVGRGAIARQRRALA